MSLPRCAWQSILPSGNKRAKTCWERCATPVPAGILIPMADPAHIVPRRTVLKAATAATAVTAATGAALAAAAPATAASAAFRHGVASGDPLPDGILLWTRVTPTPDAVPGSGRGADVTVRWQV